MRNGSFANDDGISISWSNNPIFIKEFHGIFVDWITGKLEIHGTWPDGKKWEILGELVDHPIDTTPHSGRCQDPKSHIPGGGTMKSVHAQLVTSHLFTDSRISFLHIYDSPRELRTNLLSFRTCASRVSPWACWPTAPHWRSLRCRSVAYHHADRWGILNSTPTMLVINSD